MIHRRAIALDLAAPWLTRGNLVGLFGVDAPLARLPNDDFYIPGTLVVGKLAEAFRHFAAVCGAGSVWADDLDHKFGHASAGNDETRNGREGRRRLFVGDLVCVAGQGDPLGTRTRVAIDTLTGAATRGALQVIEQPFAPGASVGFVGELRLLATDDEVAADAFFKRVEKALAWITQFGGDRTVGFGVNKGARLCAPKALPALEALAGKPRLRLRFSFHDPLCVGDLRTSGNTYMSSAVIPGGAIKGALANQILTGAGLTGTLSRPSAALDAATAPLAEHFAKLRISHAFPIEKAGVDPKRPRRVPVSWVTTSAQSFGDWAALDNPEVAGLLDHEAPKFSPDWKSDSAAAAEGLTGWSEPATDLRIRTQIHETLRAAQKNRLFAIGYRRNDTHDWIADVDFEGDEADRAAVFEALQSVLQEGLIGVGRGGAFAGVTASVPHDRAAVVAGTVIMSLQTPALLRKPDPATTGDVTAAYRAAFDDLGAPGTLKAAFVREQMRGAAFMARRLKDASYKPWLLTEPGSVFVFENVADTAKFTDWQSKGLGIPPATLASYGLPDNDLWRYCPYLPENGYGEVAFGLTGGIAAPQKVQALAGVIA